MQGIEILLSSLNDAVWSIDLSTNKFIYVNQRLAEIWEKPIEEIKSKPWNLRELIHPEDLEYRRNEMAKLSVQQKVEMEYRILVGDKVKWILDKVMKFDGEGEQPSVLAGIVSDISARKEIELKLVQSEKTYRYLFINNPNPLWIYDLQTLRFLAVNHAAIHTYGYTEEEFLNMTISDIRPEEDIERMKYKVSQITESYKPAAFWQHKRKDGSILWAEVSGHGIDYEGHKAEFVLAIDVTQRISTYEDVIRREKLLASLIDSQTNYLIRINVHGYYTFCNSPFLRKMRYSVEELLGMPYSITTPDYNVDSFNHLLEKCIKNPGTVVNITHEKKDREGNIFWSSWEFITITDTRNNIIELQGIGRDITEEIKNKEKIRASENNLNALINNTKDLIWSIDKNYRLISANKTFRNMAKFFTGKELSAGDYMLMSEFMEWKSYYDRSLAGESYTVTETLISKEDFVLKEEISFNPMYNSEGKIIGVGCFAHDISERLEKESQILNQNNRLREITSLASHEIRGPVASMLGLLSILNKSKIVYPPNLEIIHYLEEATVQLDAVIHLIVEKTLLVDNSKKE